MEFSSRGTCTSVYISRRTTLPRGMIYFYLYPSSPVVVIHILYIYERSGPRLSLALVLLAFQTMSNTVSCILQGLPNIT